MGAKEAAPVARLTADDVRRVCGDVSAARVAAILACEPTLDDLTEAAAWLAGNDETTPRRHLEPHGAAALVYEILAADTEFEEDRPR